MLPREPFAGIDEHGVTWAVNHVRFRFLMIHHHLHTETQVQRGLRYIYKSKNLFRANKFPEKMYGILYYPDLGGGAHRARHYVHNIHMVQHLCWADSRAPARL